MVFTKRDSFRVAQFKRLLCWLKKVWNADTRGEVGSMTPARKLKEPTNTPYG